MPLTPTEKRKVRAALADYCLRAETAELRWHYSQQRPYSGLGVPPERTHVNDCSGYVALCFFHAAEAADVRLTDPLGYRYNGFGYTGSQLAWLREHGSQVPDGHRYFVGDMALYGAGFPSHTAVCRRNGTASTALWSSHGNEAGPHPVTLRYRPDLLSVWRHPALA